MKLLLNLNKKIYKHRNISCILVENSGQKDIVRYKLINAICYDIRCHNQQITCKLIQ